ncbi:MAG: hypothetical protein P4L69_15995 [Desulfosporosinus sp.]|nr:hypothetical protein [Desulfosporosinus sp.]
MNENQVGVILEEVRDMFKTLAEGQRIIENRLGKVEEGQKLLESDMKKVKSDLQIIKSFVIAADNSFNDYESRIKALEKKTANL